MFSTIRAVTPAQMRKLWSSARSLGWGEAELHQMARDLAGKESLRDLTCEEASRVIDRLVEAGADPTRPPRPTRPRAPKLPPNVIELATDKQIGMINRLLWHLGWGAEDHYFRSCVKQAIRRQNIRTKGEASVVINMLRAKMRDYGIEEEVAESHRRHYPPPPVQDHEIA